MEWSIYHIFQTLIYWLLIVLFSLIGTLAYLYYILEWSIVDLVIIQINFTFLCSVIVSLVFKYLHKIHKSFTL